MNPRFGKGQPEGWPSHFKGRGYRITVPRRIILQVLGNAEKHLSAEEIYFRVYKLYPAIGLTTVYRTLDLLIRNGLVIKVESGEGRARYKLAERDEEENCHQHLFCMNCRSFLDAKDLTDDEIDVIKKIKEKLYKKYGFTVKSCILQFYGECKNCKKFK